MARKSTEAQKTAKPKAKKPKTAKTQSPKTPKSRKKTASKKEVAEMPPKDAAEAVLAVAEAINAEKERRENMENASAAAESPTTNSKENVKSEPKGPEMKKPTASSESIARHIGNVMTDYFKTMFGSIAVLIVGGTLLFSTGCMLMRSMTADQKSDAARSLTRTATVAWLVLDSNSSKYVSTLEGVVSTTKNAIEAVLVDEGEANSQFYEKAYAKVEASIAANNHGELAQTLERSIAKFAIQQSQKFIKTFKTTKVEDALVVVDGVFDGILDGLAVKVDSAEYIAALNAINERRLEAAKLSSLRLEAARR